jgi:hypothetical protein
LVASFFRLHIGLSIADEALYTTLAYLPLLGGKWFVHDMTIQTTTAILIYPFMYIYDNFFGTEGVMLFARYLYFVMSVVTSGFTFLFLKRYCRWTVALLLAGIIVCFVPHNMICLNYNSLGSQFFGLACMTTILALDTHSKKMSLLSGFFWVLCVYSYPTMILLFFITNAFVALRARGAPNFLHSFLKPYFLGLVVPGLFLVSILLLQGIENIKAAVVFSNHFNMPGQFWKLAYAFKMYWIYLPPPWILLLVFALWGFLEYKKHPTSPFCLILFLILYFILGGN